MLTKARSKTVLLLSLLILSTALMIVVDGFIQPGYWVKSGIKLLLFLIVPFVYCLLFRDALSHLKALFLPSRSALLLAALLGTGVFGVIMGAYFLLRGVIDFSGITANLTATAGVSRENFIFVALYISFVNSLLEEFFFRGFAFLHLKHRIPRRAAYSISAGLFALYHVGMTATMFDGIWLFALSFVGLYVGGVIFNILNEKSETIYASWLTHMCANFAINTIGMILFGII